MLLKGRINGVVVYCTVQSSSGLDAETSRTKHCGNETHPKDKQYFKSVLRNNKLDKR